jgi:hypothetical protein
VNEGRLKDEGEASKEEQAAAAKKKFNDLCRVVFDFIKTKAEKKANGCKKHP